jgi:lipopolysaccharide assembly outer membrane protein LptD (OstA)
VRTWSWAAAGVLLAVIAASCLDRGPSHRADARPQAAAAATPAEPAPGGGTAAAAPKPEPANHTTDEVVLEHADRVRYDRRTQQYELTGGVVVRHEDGVLRAQTMRLNRETKKGDAGGDLSFTDGRTVVTAQRLEIDFDAREVVFKGEVRLVTQKQPAPKSGAEKPAGAVAAKAPDEQEQPFREYWRDRTEIRCPQLVYNYRDHRALARGGVSARQKDRTGRADEAVYTDQDELLVLTGKVEMKNERGQTFRADKITVSVKEDWLEAEGGVASRLLVEQEKSPPPAAEPAPPTKEQPAETTAGP